MEGEVKVVGTLEESDGELTVKVCESYLWEIKQIHSETCPRLA